MHHFVVTRELPPFEHVNLQTAADAWSAAAGRTVEVHGIALPPHYGGLSLQQLIAGEALPPLRLTAPALVDLPNGPELTLGCLRLALLLVTDHSGRYIVMIKGPSEHEPSMQIEVGGLLVGQAQRLLAELDQLRAELNVYRGHLLLGDQAPRPSVRARRRLDGRWVVLCGRWQAAWRRAIWPAAPLPTPTSKNSVKPGVAGVIRMAVLGHEATRSGVGFI